jgi:vacuolar-type H+-ATPase subunit E/Vma4
MTLEPLREALRAETDSELRQRLEAVEDECAQLVADAEAEAHALVRRGRLEGEEAAAREGARRRAAATRKAREIRLRARRRQVDELERLAREAVPAVRSDVRYPALLERLAAVVREQLGPDAAIEVDPAGVGGMIGRRGRATVDYTLPALAERAIAGLDEELERLWR